MESVSPCVDRLMAAMLASPDVSAAVLFGSRARPEADSPADAGSDVDLQLVVKTPRQWVDRRWAESVLPPDAVQAWSVRDAFGGVKKVSVLLVDGELDMVFVPARRMRWARWGLALGLHRISPAGMRRAGDLKLLAGAGYSLLKGGSKWESFWRRVVAEVPEPRLSDAEIRNLAEGVKVDLVSIQRKLDRGELRAAQRWLHLGIAEVNFKLMHELRHRRGRRCFHDARRAEEVLDAASLAQVTVVTDLSVEGIREAAETAARVAARLSSELLDPREFGHERSAG